MSLCTPSAKWGLLKTVYQCLCFSQLIQFLYSDIPFFLNRDVAAFLLEQEKWVEMLKSSDNKFTTPMRGLIAFLPGKL